MRLEDYVQKHGKLPKMNDPDYIKELELTRINSKFQLLDVPLMSPGKCSNCGASKPGERKYVDFGLTLDYYGVVYICTICLKEVYELIVGVEHPSSKFQQHTEVANMMQELDKLNTALSSVERLIHGLTRSGIITNNTDSNSSDSSSDIPISGETKSDSTKSPQTKSRVTKPNSKSGRSDIPSLTDIVGTNFSG